MIRFKFKVEILLGIGLLCAMVGWLVFRKADTGDLLQAVSDTTYMATTTEQRPLFHFLIEPSLASTVRGGEPAGKTLLNHRKPIEPCRDVEADRFGHGGKLINSMPIAKMSHFIIELRGVAFIHHCNVQP